MTSPTWTSARPCLLEAVPLSLEDSVRVWLVDQKSFSPFRKDLKVAYDLAGGIAGSSLLPYTLRIVGQEGGVAQVSQPGVLVDPWNPPAGSNWIYDTTVRRMVEDVGVVADPYTGLIPAAAPRARRSDRQGRLACLCLPGLGDAEHGA